MALPFQPHPCKPCPPSCADVFDRVVVSYLVRAGSQIMWALLPEFRDAGPYSFQLQVGTTFNNDADDWADVGAPVVDQYFAIDGEQRVYGTVNWAFYRVVLTTSVGVYRSQPVNMLGTLAWRDWRIAGEIIRKERLDQRLSAQEGYLLKRRISGEKCPDCLDFQTGEVRDPDCATCYGTGYRCGYYYPMACVWAKLSPKTRRLELDSGQLRGTVNDVVIKARMLMCELLEEDDVWVNKVTDDRYFLHRVQHVSEWRGMPLIGEVEIRPIPFTHILYTLAIPEQLVAIADMVGG